MDKQKLIEKLERTKTEIDKYVPKFLYSGREYDIARNFFAKAMDLVIQYVKQQEESNNELINMNQEENKGKSLIIFNKNGETLKFEQVTEFKEMSDWISFKYYGLSTQTKKSAVFYKSNIAGYAFEEVAE